MAAPERFHAGESLQNFRRERNTAHSRRGMHETIIMISLPIKTFRQCHAGQRFYPLIVRNKRIDPACSDQVKPQKNDDADERKLA